MNETIMANEQYYINGIQHTNGRLFSRVISVYLQKIPWLYWYFEGFELFDVFEHFNCGGEFPIY